MMKMLGACPVFAPSSCLWYHIIYHTYQILSPTCFVSNEYIQVEDERYSSQAESAATPQQHHEMSRPQHADIEDADDQKPSANQDAALPQSTTMRTASVDTDSQSVSASISPVPSTPSPLVPAYHPTQEAHNISNQVQVAIKILVSNSASGLIIGRAGSTISDLQAKTQTRIKLSQGGNYYPGTSDRVCLIQGPLPNASFAVEMVLAKLYELQSLQLASTLSQTRPDSPRESLPQQNAPTSFVVRLLVPSTCCGMIIGRGGSNIKSLKEKSEVTYIQLSPKEHEVMIGGSTLSTSERIMTITGPGFTGCVTCVQMIMTNMAQNPEISRYINMTTSYSKNLAAASAYVVATPSGFFQEQEPFHPQDTSRRYSMGDQQFGQGQYTPSPPREQNIGLLQQQLMSQQGSPTGYDAYARPLFGDPSTMVQPQQYDQNLMPSPMPSPVSSPQRIDHTMAPPFPQYQQPPPTGQTMQFWSPDGTTGSLDRNIPSGNFSSIDQLSQSFQQASIRRPSSHSSPSQASLRRPSSHSSLQHMASPTPIGVQLGVPDARIGSILGRGGKTLTELEALSRTKIRLSQRGEYIPGTQNRVVTITGNTLHDVEHAQNLVNQRLGASFSRSSSRSSLSSSFRQLKDG